MDRTKDIIIGMSGATGSLYGIQLLKLLKKEPDIRVHLVMSEWAGRTILEETDDTPEQVCRLADFCYANDNMAAPVASGSFPGRGMVIAPCSMKTVAGIAGGYTDNLLLRAADVCLKERRPLVLMARETPLSAIHLENMLRLARAGAIILPPMPAFYTRPEGIEELVLQTCAHALGFLDIAVQEKRQWSSRLEQEHS